MSFLQTNDLPIQELKENFLKALQQYNRLIIEAPTGSGKSTQIPQMLIESGLLEEEMAIILQPRRLAARMLATRVAEEQQETVGQSIGYRIRLENCSSNITKVLFVTEGILLRQMVSDSLLRGVKVLIFDEFHERNLYSDMSLTLALALQEKERPDLIIIIMSATLDTSSLLNFFTPCAILKSLGRTFPVSIQYLPEDRSHEEIWETATYVTSEIFTKTEGNILIFMPGRYEIFKTIENLKKHISSNCKIVPLHGDMTLLDQDSVLDSDQKMRKIIVSTNIAETSLTIENVTVVIDSGLARIAKFDQKRGVNTLLVEKISLASADQRAGRAGRVAPGLCIRLWTEKEHLLKHQQDEPEICRIDLAEALLTLYAINFSSVESMKWLDHPPSASIKKAEDLLQDMGAIDKNGITELGERMISFPAHPRYSRMLLVAHELNVVREVALIIALTQTRSLFLRTDKEKDRTRRHFFRDKNSDFAVMSHVLHWSKENNFDSKLCSKFSIHTDAASQAWLLYEQFLELAQEQKLQINEEKNMSSRAVIKSILAGFSDQVARRCDVGGLLCDVVHGRRGFLNRESAASNSRLLVVTEINEIGHSGTDVRSQLSLAVGIDESMLRELFPNDIIEKSSIFFDTDTHRVQKYTEIVFRDLVLQTIKRDADRDKKSSLILAKGLLENQLPLKQWKNTVVPWLERVHWLRYQYPHLNFPDFKDTHTQLKILAILCDGYIAYREIVEKPILPILKNYLTKEQNINLEKLAPLFYTLPSGVRLNLQYKANGEVMMSGIIQNFFALNTLPTLVDGKVTIAAEIQAPNHRTIQITRDIHSFWNNTYQRIKKQLIQKYPKHHWIE